MKKPGKPKPKRRARKAAAAAPVQRRAGPTAASSQTYRLAPVVARQTAARPSPGANTFARALEAYPSDDRSALALLLLPFLILAASLGLNQTWRYTVNALPEIAAHAPAVRPIAPPDVQLIPPGELRYATEAPTVVPELVPPGELRYSTEAPPISVASLDVRPAVPLGATPPQVDIAAWSPARPAWSDDLAAPPLFEPSPPVAGAPTDVCEPSPAQLASFSTIGRLTRAPRMPLADPSDPVAFGLKLATAARAQTQDLVIYSARYHHMAYPMGDMPSFYGACTDVIIRAYRTVGIDLQADVQRAHAGRGDTNIDHRRTETLRTLFTRAGASLPITRFAEDYKPGDIVTYHRPFSRVSASHIAIVSDVLAPTGRPMIVHNRGWGPQLEDALFVDRVTGHYRYTGPAAVSAVSAVTELPAPPRHVVRASFPGAARGADHTRAPVPRRVLGLATSPSPKAH